MKFLVTISIFLFLFSCNNKSNDGTAEKSPAKANPTTAKADEGVNPDGSDGTYFSIKQFLDERQEDEKNEPYVLLKVIKHDNKKDSSFLPLDETAWKELKAHFEDADIGDKKFLNRYEAQMFEDNLTQTIFLQYIAKNDDEVVRKMDINIDPKNEKIKSVYIELVKKSMSNTLINKILYTPEKLLQVQSLEKSKIKKSDSKETVTEYHYEY